MMRRLSTALLLLLLTARLCSAAITAATLWEVRPTNGSDLNGCGFDSTIANAGTDYSQQNSAQLSLSDMATTGAVTTVTSVTGGFTAAMIGDILRIESGTNWTVGYYQILTRVDTNTITVDRAPTSAAGVSGTGKVGGACKTLTLQTTTKLTSGMASGNTVYVKNEAWNAAEVLAGNGTVALPRILEGYNTARGDAPTGSNRPHNNKAGVGIPFTVHVTNWVIKHIWASHSASSGGFWQNGQQSNFVTYLNCRASNNVGSGFILNINDTLVNSEADTNTTYGVVMASAPNVIYGSYLHGNTSGGVNLAAISTGANPFTILHTIIAANTGPGVVSTFSPLAILLIGNTIDGNTGATTDGLSAPLIGTGSIVYNNQFTTNGRDGVRMTSSGTIYPVIDYNNYSANVGTARTNFLTGTHDIALAPGYVNSGSGNYAVGANTRNVAFPGTFPASTSVGHMDIGAVQSGVGAATQRATACVQ